MKAYIRRQLWLSFVVLSVLIASATSDLTQKWKIICFVMASTAFAAIFAWNKASSRLVNDQKLNHSSTSAGMSHDAPPKTPVNRYYRQLLISMPIFYALGLVGAQDTPLPIRILCTVVVAGIYLYVLKLYKKSSRV